ncbi:unnamed protein product, partial [marine sediment metagenome]
MDSQRLLDRFMPCLLAGQRQQCRDVLGDAMRDGMAADHLYRNMIWQAMENVEQLYNEDKINLATEHMAIRINRLLADQLQAHLPRGAPNGKRILITCANGETEELGAQMCSDLFESDGWDVYFVGGGIPNDEILSLVGNIRPDILLIFGSQPAGVPEVRKLI